MFGTVHNLFNDKDYLTQDEITSVKRQLECFTAEQLDEFHIFTKRIRRYYAKLLDMDGQFSHVAMSRCFYLLHRLIELPPEDYKITNDHILNIRWLFIILGDMTRKFIMLTGMFPYGSDLHDLLVAYIELESLVYLNVSYNIYEQDDVESYIIQILLYMLFNPAPASPDGMCNTEDACTLRCMYTLKMVSLNIRSVFPSIENMLRKLSLQLEKVKLFDENAMDFDEPDYAFMDDPIYSNASKFLKRCREVSTNRLYYFNDDDQAEIEELQPIYNDTPTSGKLKNHIHNAETQKSVVVLQGVVTDAETINIMEFYRSRFCNEKVFQYLTNMKNMVETPIINLADLDSDDDEINAGKGINRSIPISLDSPIETDSPITIDESSSRQPNDSTSTCKNNFSNNFFGNNKPKTITERNIFATHTGAISPSGTHLSSTSVALFCHELEEEVIFRSFNTTTAPCNIIKL